MEKDFSFGCLLKLVFPIFPPSHYFWARFVRRLALALSLPPPLGLVLDVQVGVALKRAALGGAGGAVISADFRVQRQGEGSGERGRGCSALSPLPAPGPVLGPAGAQLHFGLPL